MADSKTPPRLYDDAWPVTDDVPPSNDDGAPSQVTLALFHEFLGKKATQDRIREVVLARVKRGTSPAEVDEIVQETNGRALITTALPRSVEGMRPWISTVAANAAADHSKAEKKREKRMDRSVDVDELPPDEAVTLAGEEDASVELTPAEAGETFRGGRLVRWLDAKVRTKADRLTFEMILRKAATKASNEEVAAEFGMTEAAYDNRLLRFKAKWVPAWTREKARRRRIALLVLGILLLLVAAALAWVVRPRPRVVEPPRVEPPSVVPVPSATSSGPPRCHPAQPTPRPPDEARDPKDDKGGLPRR